MLQNKIIYHIGGTGDTKTMNEFIQQHQLLLLSNTMDG